LIIKRKKENPPIVLGNVFAYATFGEKPMGLDQRHEVGSRQCR
jgi:hypothetical protein